VTPPLISICIPTFQRAGQLAPTLSRVAAVIAVAGWQERVEICVSDNASGDDTPAVIAAFQPAGIAVKKFCQRENVGFSRNLQTVSRMAEGEYLLFQGDDDALASGVCATLERALAERPAVALFPTLPDQPMDGDWSARKAERWLVDGREIARVLGIFHLTFLGNFVVRRADYLAQDEGAFCDSLYPHVAVLFRILARERARWVPEALFEFEEQFKSWNQPLLTAVDLTRVYADGLLPPGRDRAFIRAFYDRTVRSIPRAFLNRKLGRPDQPGNKYLSLALANLLACYRWSPKHRFIAAAYWLAGTTLPAAALRTLLGEKPRKVEF
jgi:glycosyltransferase involved in cell wall biosynthesis